MVEKKKSTHRKQNLKEEKRDGVLSGYQNRGKLR